MDDDPDVSEDPARPTQSAPGRAVPAGTPTRVPERAPDDSDVGWGERPEDQERDRDARYREDRPPHWGSD